MRALTRLGSAKVALSASGVTGRDKRSSASTRSPTQLSRRRTLLLFAQSGSGPATALVSSAMDHLAIPVTDQQRSRRFYEAYFGFGDRPARRFPDGVLMLYNAKGFALALGTGEEPIGRGDWMHFGVSLPDRDAVLRLRDRLVRDDVDVVELWDEAQYVSVKCLDPDGYIVEAFWEPED